MTQRTWITVGIIVGALLAGPAQAQQSFDINLGYFAPRAEDARVDGDVLTINRSYLLFEMKDFAGFLGEAGWSVELGRFFETGVGVGYFQRTVPTVYADFVHAGGGEIEQVLKLRNIPVTATLRMFPLGHRRVLQPYVGAGLGVHFWRYAETGEFVDFSDDSTFRDNFVQSGTAVGPVGLFGVRARIGGMSDVGVELRYQWAQGDLGNDFLGDKLDLGGYAVLSTFKFRF
jgi:outer membrane protein W